MYPQSNRREKKEKEKDKRTTTCTNGTNHNNNTIYLQYISNLLELKNLLNPTLGCGFSAGASDGHTCPPATHVGLQTCDDLELILAAA
jgi:hypothetical protein